MKILCVADSLAMPREGVAYEETWFYKLKELLGPFNVDCIPQFRRALTSASLSDPDFSSYWNPDLTILQIGICDCAPRRYRRTSFLWIALKSVLNRIRPGLFDSLIKRRKRQMKFADVPLVDFKKNLYDYFQSLIKVGGAKIIIIKILSSDKESLTKKSPELRQSVDIYNSVFEELQKVYKDVVIVDPQEKMCEKHFVEDGYHVNALGHEVIFDLLKKVLNQSILKDA